MIWLSAYLYVTGAAFVYALLREHDCPPAFAVPVALLWPLSVWGLVYQSLQEWAWK